MRGIERFFAALVLAGAVAGAAAFSFRAGSTHETAVAPLQLTPPGHANPSTVIHVDLPAPIGTSVAPVRRAIRTKAPVRRTLLPLRPAPVVGAPRVIHRVYHPALPAAPTTRVAPEPAAPTPAPAPAPAPPPAPVPVPAPTPAPAAHAATTPPAPVVTVAANSSTAPRGHGKAKGHDKHRWKTDEPEVVTTPLAEMAAPADEVVPATPVPAVDVPVEALPPSEEESDDNGHGHDHGRGHGRDK